MVGRKDDISGRTALVCGAVSTAGRGDGVFRKFRAHLQCDDEFQTGKNLFEKIGQDVQSGQRRQQAVSRNASEPQAGGARKYDLHQRKAVPLVCGQSAEFAADRPRIVRKPSVYLLHDKSRQQMESEAIEKMYADLALQDTASETADDCGSENPNPVAGTA